MRPRIIVVDNITGIGGNNGEISDVAAVIGVLYSSRTIKRSRVW